ncbi:MAG: endonuclease/exonuclease/phosphatase family protein [Faunusvirus sp.]|jgi:ubiquitin C-terminal hydrolase/endonuclease/exonuclease/phosphatase family metal-dependent hydrolase|uniref:Endonuclease/exonuclease/phosphatase family protein n=1 Tax=Faunusvirus sp. TaxID=2487766 RepID=A0A3G4ZXG1_9VIRU|nr:MAG: endonuclease/exonuclease/phosphatase family protein [Faunusvirus sp.]
MNLRPLQSVYIKRLFKLVSDSLRERSGYADINVLVAQFDDIWKNMDNYETYSGDTNNNVSYLKFDQVKLAFAKLNEIDQLVQQKNISSIPYSFKRINLTAENTPVYKTSINKYIKMLLLNIESYKTNTQYLSQLSTQSDKDIYDVAINFDTANLDACIVDKKSIVLKETPKYANNIVSFKFAHATDDDSMLKIVSKHGGNADEFHRLYHLLSDDDVYMTQLTNDHDTDELIRHFKYLDNSFICDIAKRDIDIHDYFTIFDIHLIRGLEILLYDMPFNYIAMITIVDGLTDVQLKFLLNVIKHVADDFVNILDPVSPINRKFATTNIAKQSEILSTEINPDKRQIYEYFVICALVSQYNYSPDLSANTSYGVVFYNYLLKSYYYHVNCFFVALYAQYIRSLRYEQHFNRVTLLISDPPTKRQQYLTFNEIKDYTDELDILFAYYKKHNDGSAFISLYIALKYCHVMFHKFLTKIDENKILMTGKCTDPFVSFILILYYKIDRIMNIQNINRAHIDEAKLISPVSVIPVVDNSSGMCTNPLVIHDDIYKLLRADIDYVVTPVTEFFANMCDLVKFATQPVIMNSYKAESPMSLYMHFLSKITVGNGVDPEFTSKLVNIADLFKTNKSVSVNYTDNLLQPVLLFVVRFINQFTAYSYIFNGICAQTRTEDKKQTRWKLDGDVYIPINIKMDQKITDAIPQQTYQINALNNYVIFYSYSHLRFPLQQSIEIKYQQANSIFSVCTKADYVDKSAGLNQHIKKYVLIGAFIYNDKTAKHTTISRVADKYIQTYHGVKSEFKISDTPDIIPILLCYRVDIYVPKYDIVTIASREIMPPQSIPIKPALVGRFKYMQSLPIHNIGLKNCGGNACYFNSMIQLLLAMPDMIQYLTNSAVLEYINTKYIISDDEKQNKQTRGILWNILSICRDLTDTKMVTYDSEKYINPVIDIMSKIMEVGGKIKNDAGEFLEHFMNILPYHAVNGSYCEWEHYELNGITSDITPSSTGAFILNYLLIEYDDVGMDLGDLINKQYIANTSKPSTASVNKYTYEVNSSFTTGEYIICKLHIEFQNQIKVEMKTRITESIKVGNKTYKLTGVIKLFGANFGAAHYMAYRVNQGAWYQFNDNTVTASTFNGATSNERGTPYILCYKLTVSTYSYLQLIDATCEFFQPQNYRGAITDLRIPNTVYCVKPAIHVFTYVTAFINLLCNIPDLIAYHMHPEFLKLYEQFPNILAIRVLHLVDLTIKNNGLTLDDVYRIVYNAFGTLFVTGNIVGRLFVEFLTSLTAVKYMFNLRYINDEQTSMKIFYKNEFKTSHDPKDDIINYSCADIWNFSGDSGVFNVYRNTAYGQTGPTIIDCYNKYLISLTGNFDPSTSVKKSIDNKLITRFDNLYGYDNKPHSYDLMGVIVHNGAKSTDDNYKCYVQNPHTNKWIDCSTGKLYIGPIDSLYAHGYTPIINYYRQADAAYKFYKLPVPIEYRKISNISTPSSISTGSFTQIDDQLDPLNPYKYYTIDEKQQQINAYLRKDLFNANKKYSYLYDFKSSQAWPTDTYGQSQCENDTKIQNMPPVPPSVRICSFNVHNWVKKCPPTGKEYKSFYDTITNIRAHIICLQEIVPYYHDKPQENDDIAVEHGNFSEIITKFKNMGYNYYVIHDTHYMRDGETKHNINVLDMNGDYFMLCNAIFSQYPIVTGLSKQFGLGNNRILSKVVVNMGQDKVVVVYNTHIEVANSRVINGVKSDKQIQLDNIADIVCRESLTDVAFNPNNNIVLTGDFNNSYTNSALSYASIDRVLAHIDYKNGAQIGFTGVNQHSIIDHFFVAKHMTSNVNNSLIIKSSASDHYPVIIDIQIPVILA